MFDKRYADMHLRIDAIVCPYCGTTNAHADDVNCIDDFIMSRVMFNCSWCRKKWEQHIYVEETKLVEQNTY